MASDFVKIPASEAFHVIGLCFLHAQERRHWEWPLYAPLGYLHILAMSNLKIEDPNAIFMPYPQRFIMSTEFSEDFPPQTHSTYIIPDTTHTLETLTTAHATTTNLHDINLDGETIPVVPTADPNVYLSHPGSLSIKTLHVTLWEVKPLNAFQETSYVITEPGGKTRKITVSTKIKWADTAIVSVVETMKVEQILLQVLYTFHRYHGAVSVKLAFVAGDYITILLFKRPKDLAKLPADMSVTAMLADKHYMSTKLAPEADFLPTVLVPPRRMFDDNARPSTALRFSLYTMYIDGVPGVSVNRKSDIFHLADNALQGQPFVNDASFDEDTETVNEFIKYWYRKHTKGSPPPSPTTPTELPGSPAYIPHNTPSANDTWGRQATKRQRIVT